MNLKRCPACRSARFWGAPVGYLPTTTPGLFKRCEVCKGHGLVTLFTEFVWEGSL